MTSTPWLLAAGVFNFDIESGHLFSRDSEILGRRYSRQPKEHEHFYFFLLHDGDGDDDDTIRLAQPFTQARWYLCRSSFATKQNPTIKYCGWDESLRQ